MKNLKPLWVCLLALGLSPLAVAAPGVDLTVSGSIVPASCLPTLTDSDFNFLRHNAADLNRDTHTQLGEAQTRTLDITCQGPVKFGLRGIDNRAGSAVPTGPVSPYGLGVTPANENSGAFYVTVDPAQSSVDDKPAFATVGDSGGESWSASTSSPEAVRNTGELLGFTDAEGSASGPQPITQAHLQLSVLAHIAPANTLTLDEEVVLDGAATLELVYL